MKIHCPRPECSSHQNPSPKTRVFVRNGSFFRKSDSRRIARYLCNCCGKQFSNSTFSPNYRQKKRRLTHELILLISSGVSQRRGAKNLGVTRNTFVRRFRYLAAQSKLEQSRWLKLTYGEKKLQFVQFDDLETSEHTKQKPVSVSAAVDPGTYQLLTVQVSQMPARGHLAEKARKKYGFRRDERPKAWDQMMRELVPYVEEKALWRSDDNPHYPKHLKKHFPQARHETVKGGRARSAGQGELKEGFDPIFAINHTFAMLRANISRLIRRTWSTTKTIQGLIDHLSIFVVYYNQVLKAKTALPSSMKGASLFRTPPPQPGSNSAPPSCPARFPRQY
jgi:transposase-like protein